MTNAARFITSAALVFYFLSVAPAAADELVAQCRIANPIDGADKICKCMSEKITGAERDAAIKAMKVTNEATTRGIVPDQSIWTDDMVKAMTNVAQVEAICIPQPQSGPAPG